MGLFRRNKTKREPQSHGPVCSHCGSTNTVLAMYHGSDHPEYVRVWRGQRSVIYKCLDCSLEFYGNESQTEITEEDPIVFDKEALQAAEEELKREVDEENDHRCW